MARGSSQLGQFGKMTVRVLTVCNKANDLSGFHALTMGKADLALREFINALQSGITHEYLKNATRFLPL